VVGFSGCLIDVYETVLSCDFAAYTREMQRVAKVPVEVWDDAFVELGPAVTEGRVSLADVYSKMIRDAGRKPSEDLLRDLVGRDQQVLIECSEVYADTIPFLEMLKVRGVSNALVSNCAENTRPLLKELGLADLVDAVVLSCEIGYAKPSSAIYRSALERLGVEAAGAVFVDDQAAYCSAAAALGMRAVQISRRGDGSFRLGDSIAVGSLRGLEAMF
jgi:putative hydrolase of the HAD superfamily